MSELTTKTGADVGVDVKRIFGDEDAVQITDADILRWINSAQRSIVATNPILQMTANHDIIAGQDAYTFPSDRVQYVQALYYDGMPLEAYSYPEAQEYVITYDPDKVATSDPQIWYQWGQTITLYPKPRTTITDGLRVDFVAIPAELTNLNQTLSLPDRYFETIVNYVLQKAHQTDENFDGANYVRSQYSEGLAQLSEQENRVSLRVYPRMTVRPEDL